LADKKGVPRAQLTGNQFRTDILKGIRGARYMDVFQCARRMRFGSLNSVLYATSQTPPLNPISIAGALCPRTRGSTAAEEMAYTAGEWFWYV